MKRFTIALALAMMIFAPAWAEKVTPETARKVATTFLNNNGAKTAQLTDLSKAAGFPNLYIFSTENSFVIMSADDCVKPVLGYSLTNTFIAEGMPENICSWLQGYSDEIQCAIDNKQKATSKIAQQWKDLMVGKSNAAKADVVVGPLIQTKWSQGGPYNNLCPSGSVTGCVATAMAQIMKYWNYPTRGIGSHDYQYGTYGTIKADFGATTYDWDNMTDTYSSSSTDTQKAAVATLMYHCGVSVEMKYRPSESSSHTKRSSFSMKTYFNFDCSYLEMKAFEESKWIDTLKYELDHGRPILYSGYGSKGGHAFVCDGYNDEDNFHFNWGWGGSSDGYFSITTLNPGSYNFSLNQSAVINIKPLTKAILPIVLTLNQTEGAINLNWIDSQNSTSYNIYRNNTLIASSSGTTYTDVEPAFGSNIYYVRGMKDDTLSLPSNYESVTVNYPTPKVNDLHVDATDNNTSLSWNVPKWCYPSTADEETFSYVDEERLDNNDSHYIWSEAPFVLSWGHRYPVDNLTGYNGKAIHEISFFSMYPGAFDIVVYQGTEDDNPVEEIARKSISTARIGWSRVGFSTPAIIDASRDLWIFIINTDFKVHTIYNTEVADNINGCYYSYSNPTQGCNTIGSNVTWLIRAYLTDGTYSYNLYQDGVRIAQNLNQTTYNISLNNNAANLFTVKTNYYSGETEASNKIGFAKGNASLEALNLGDNDKMTVMKNSSLAISGNLANSYPANLILEDSAQLIHSSAGVKATVKKDITAYTSDQDGWNFIASPIIESIEPSEDNGILNGNYDLYFYEEPSNMWRNHKEHIVDGINQNTASDFSLIYKQGYLYANDTPTTLYFSGTLAPGNSAISSNTLSFNNKGFNFLGNPFICNAMIEGDFFVLNKSGNKVVLAEQNRQIAPCEGVFVQVSAAGQTVSFSKATTKGSHSTSLDLVVSQGHSTLDRTRVRLGEGVNTEKFTLDGDQSAQLTLWHDGQEYAVAFTNGLNELPLNFKAAENGTYTIGIEANSLDLDYLHLIDNLTGNDIDLLATPNYSFEAKSSDYASRFRLVFSNCEDAVDNNEPFAYIDNGNIVINQEGTLQIVDMTGRIVFLGDPKHCIHTTRMAPGVYVLRLVDGENVKTQKIVIE